MIFEVHRLLWRDVGPLARFAAPWVIVLLLAEAALSWIDFSSAQATEPGISASTWLIYAASTALLVGIGAIVGVFWHRRLLAELVRDGAGEKNATRRVLADYIWRNAVIIVSALVPLALIGLGLTELGGALIEKNIASEAQVAEHSVLSVTSQSEVSASVTDEASEEVSADANWICLVCIAFAIIVLLPLIALISYVPTRLSLALPATAISAARRTFSQTWSLSRGHFWRLFWGGMVAYWPIWVITIANIPTDVAAYTRLQFVMSSVLGTGAIFLSELIWVGFFSLAYRHITSQARSDDALTSHPELGDGDG